MFWESNYSAGNAVERRLKKGDDYVWRRGRVAQDWQARPGFGVRGTYDDGGNFRVSREADIRHT